MSDVLKSRIGVFICRCGGKIDNKLNPENLQAMVEKNPLVSHAEILPYSCELPGLGKIKQAVKDKQLDRVIIAGCESRIMIKKFEKTLLDSGLEQGQIEMVNLRDHVAQANVSEPDQMETKGAKLIAASAAALNVLVPSPKVQVGFNGPVMIVGGGIATYPAALELIRKGVETIIAVTTDDPDDEIRMLHEQYPGERHYHDRLRAIMEEVNGSTLIKKITAGEISKIMGRFGDYQVTFAMDGDRPDSVYECGAIIAALDGQMQNQGSDFGHDGVRVVCHTEMEEYIWIHGGPDGKVVFWINDLETPGRPWSNLSARSAWNLATYIKGNRSMTEVSILYNNKMDIPLSAAERVLARSMGIKWIPYDSRIRPTVQAGYITYSKPDDNIEEELAWDKLCLSPLRTAGRESLKVARVLGFDVKDGEFLERNPQMVRPEQVGHNERFLAGSALKPCDLRDAIRQGRRVAANVIDLVEKARNGELYAPRMVCTVDSTKCIGCGLCNEICDCGGIEPFEGKGGNIPRQVDPMVCTGGGTCAAACPYHALTLQNNTTDMREARLVALSQALETGEAVGFGCGWGGAAAADHAGLKGMKHDPRFYLMPVPCIGQLDPKLMGRAFVEGANGLLLIGCPPEECHHSYGVDHTWSRVNLVRKLFTLCGIERSRLALAHSDMNHPEQFVKTVNSFMATLDKMGPINRDERTVELLQAVYDTLNNSRVRWVLGAGLRRPYEDHYPSDQRNALAYDETLSEILLEEFVKTRVMNLLKKNKELMNLKEISSQLDVEPNAIISSMQILTGEGLISRIFKDRTPYYISQ